MDRNEFRCRSTKMVQSTTMNNLVIYLELGNEIKQNTLLRVMEISCQRKLNLYIVTIRFKLIYMINTNRQCKITSPQWENILDALESFRLGIIHRKIYIGKVKHTSLWFRILKQLKHKSGFNMPQ